jgi:6-phosphofructokinase 1
MNAVVRAAVKLCTRYGIQAIGVSRGFDGLIEGDFKTLTPQDVDDIGGWGGSVLLCARSKSFRTEEGRQKAAAQLGDAGLLVVGGNGSLKGADVFARETGLPVVGVPASIDNDIGCTTQAVGVDTALNTIVEACDRVNDTGRAHKRVFVLEVMGRQCGYLAISSAVAAGADACLFLEQGRDAEEILAGLKKVIADGFSEARQKKKILIIKAEGVQFPTPLLVRELQAFVDQENPGVSVRAAVLGHLVRGGAPSYRDRMLAGRFGVAAVEALFNGHSRVMTAFRPELVSGLGTGDPMVKLVPFDAVQEETVRLLDGSSDVTRRRVRMMENYAGVLAI